MKTTQHPQILLFTIVGLTLVASLSHAQNITSYTSRVAFEAALSNESTETFDSYTFPPGNDGYNGHTYSYFGEGVPFTVGDVTVEATGDSSQYGGDYIVAEDGFPTQNDGSNFVATDNLGTTSVSVPNINALGFDVQTSYGADGSVAATVTDSLGNTASGTFAANASDDAEPTTFLGFIDNNPGATITSIQTTSGEDFDDVSFQSVPEPATWSMMGMLAGLLLLVRRARRRA